jgi:hypothetical protein
LCAIFYYFEPTGEEIQDENRRAALYQIKQVDKVELTTAMTTTTGVSYKLLVVRCTKDKEY